MSKGKQKDDVGGWSLLEGRERELMSVWSRTGDRVEAARRTTETTVRLRSRIG